MTTYLHADLDSFFVSVEMALDPTLLGPVVAVGGGRSVVVSASYAARERGVSAGMPLAHARRLCPSVRAVPARLPACRAAGEAALGVLRDLGGRVRRVSVDEAVWQLPAALDPLALAIAARAQVRSEFGLPLSIGAAGDPVTAKVACSQAKPDGLLVLTPGSEASFLAPLDVSCLPGVGPATAEKLRLHAIRTIGDLASEPIASLAVALGKSAAETLQRAARGESRISMETPAAQSVGVERTFPAPALHSTEAFAEVLGHALGRLGQSALAARTVTVRRRVAGVVKSSSTTLAWPSSSPAVLARAAEALASAWSGEQIDQIGVEFSGLGSGTQLELPLELGPDPLVLHETHSFAECVFYGMRVTHPRFGDGTVTERQSGAVVVRFQDGYRVIDEASPTLSW